jgi:hypothetical protein
MVDARLELNFNLQAAPQFRGPVMLKSVPYLAALLFSALLISLSAHADKQTPKFS